MAKRFTFLLTAALAWGCTGPPNPSAADAPVRARLEQYYEDFSARDWEAFASHFWPGAAIATAWQPIGEERVRVVHTTVEEFIADAPNGPDSREIFAEWMEEATIRVAGDLAHAWVRFGARFGDPGEVDEWTGVDAISLLRVDGVWKIATLVFASDD